jgi:ribosomal protein S14
MLCGCFCLYLFTGGEIKNLRRINKKVERDRLSRTHVLKFSVHKRFLKFGALADIAIDEDERTILADVLDSLPKTSSRSRVRNYCMLTGRPRAVTQFFRMSRHMIKKHSLLGELYGIRKSSW